jgi:hypothetical protein
MSVKTSSGHISQIPARQLVYGIGGLVTFCATAVVAVTLWGGTAKATIAFSNETGYRCAFCHATPGTNMQALTRFGQCFRNSGYNVGRCRR